MPSLQEMSLSDPAASFPHLQLMVVVMDLELLWVTEPWRVASQVPHPPDVQHTRLDPSR